MCVPVPYHDLDSHRHMPWSFFNIQWIEVICDWLGISIMCPSEATCLPSDCCFSELAQWISIMCPSGATCLPSDCCFSELAQWISIMWPSGATCLPSDCCFSELLQWISIMWPSGATCLPSDCCFSELPQWIPHLSDLVFIVIPFKCNLFSSWYSWEIVSWALYNNYPLTYVWFNWYDGKQNFDK